MRTRASAIGVWLLATSFLVVLGAPWSKLYEPNQQTVFHNPVVAGGHEGEPHPEWGPLEHCSGIAPYHDAPGANIAPPKGCTVTSAAFLIRHSSIYANDDEWDDYMKPFVERIQQNREAFAVDQDSPLAFLQEWQSLINDDNLEKLTEPGANDAHDFGKRISKLYPHLLPPRHPGSPPKGRMSDSSIEAEKIKTPFKVWTASSERDIGTAKAFIRGAFPHRQEGDDGEGDGKSLELVEVSNKDPDWSASLTPHKVCPAFSKEPGKPDARAWLEVWGQTPLARLRSQIPDFEFQIEDVIAIAMLCGYESVIKGVGKSDFCSYKILSEEDYHSFGYWNDLIYHKMVGYASPVAPYLGVHWLNTSTHNLLSQGNDDEADHQSFHDLIETQGKKDPNLPDPDRPPNSTHATQSLYVYFTHREEPPVALVALGLWNQTKVGEMPTDRIAKGRIWKTSHVLPFLGHVAIERISCGAPASTFGATAAGQRKRSSDYIRTIVNGAVQRLEECDDGPGHSCPIDRFAKYVEGRMEQYKDFESACRLEEEEV